MSPQGQRSAWPRRWGGRGGAGLEAAPGAQPPAAAHKPPAAASGGVKRFQENGIITGQRLHSPRVYSLIMRRGARGALGTEGTPPAEAPTLAGSWGRWHRWDWRVQEAQPFLLPFPLQSNHKMLFDRTFEPFLFFPPPFQPWHSLTPLCPPLPETDPIPDGCSPEGKNRGKQAQRNRKKGKKKKQKRNKKKDKNRQKSEICLVNT